MKVRTTYVKQNFWANVPHVCNIVYNTQQNIARLLLFETTKTFSGRSILQASGHAAFQPCSKSGHTASCISFMSGHTADKSMPQTITSQTISMSDHTAEILMYITAIIIIMTDF